MTPKQQYDARQRIKRERRMNAEQREKEADELAALAMASLRAFLEGKASLHITQGPTIPGVGTSTIVRFVKASGQ
jgi:hypothetical protein